MHLKRRFGHMGSLPLVLSLVVSGCITEPPGPAFNQLPRDPRPFTLDWVGRYVGTATGLFELIAMENVAIEVVMTFDSPATLQCPDCITVRIGEFFGRMNLLPQTSISANWSYEKDNRLSTLTMNKFSSSATPGSVFFGTVKVESQDPAPGAVETLTAFDFVVERR